MSRPADLVQGTLDLLLLKIVAPRTASRLGDQPAPDTDLERRPPGQRRRAVLRRCTSSSRRAGSAPNGKSPPTAGARSSTRSPRPAGAPLERETASWERARRRDFAGRPPQRDLIPCPSGGGFRRLTLRLRTLLHRDRLEQELADEFQFHVEQRMELEIVRGRSPEEARRLALLAMDGIDQKKEECRDMRRMQLVEHLMQDIRYGCRSLMRKPGIRISGSARVAGARDRRQHGDLPASSTSCCSSRCRCERPRELVMLNPTGLRNGWTAGSRTWSHPVYRGLREHQQVFSGLLAECTDAVNLTIDSTTVRCRRQHRQRQLLRGARCPRIDRPAAVG